MLRETKSLEIKWASPFFLVFSSTYYLYRVAISCHVVFILCCVPRMAVANTAFSPALLQLHASRRLLQQQQHLFTCPSSLLCVSRHVVSTKFIKKPLSVAFSSNSCLIIGASLRDNRRRHGSFASSPSLCAESAFATT